MAVLLSDEPTQSQIDGQLKSREAKQHQHWPIDGLKLLLADQWEAGIYFGVFERKPKFYLEVAE